MKQYYYDSYIAPLKLDKKHYTTREGEIYPNFHDDLLERAWEVIRDKYGEMDQKTDAEMKAIFKKRIEDLYHCSEVKNYELNSEWGDKDYYTSY